MARQIQSVMGLGATHLEPPTHMSEVLAIIRALEGPDLRHQVNSSDTPENELIEPST